jgi:hypothetical protein
MAAGEFIIPEKAWLNCFSATNLLGASTSNWRLALVASTWTPDDANDELWAHMSAHEIPAGNGYSTGGGTLTGVTLGLVAGKVVFTFNAYVWTANGGYIPGWRRAVAYYLGTLNGKVNPILCHCLGIETPSPADVITPDGKTCTITPHASGILRSPA